MLSLNGLIASWNGFILSLKLEVGGCGLHAVGCLLLSWRFCSKLFYFAQIPTIFFAFVCEIFIGEAEEKVAEGFHVELSNLVM